MAKSDRSEGLFRGRRGHIDDWRQRVARSGRMCVPSTWTTKGHLRVYADSTMVRLYMSTNWLYNSSRTFKSAAQASTTMIKQNTWDRVGKKDEQKVGWV
jgi:hypothetical protein